MNDVALNNFINERNWDLLFDAIDKERVVPIVGQEFFYVENELDNNKTSVEKYLIQKLSERFNIQDDDVNFTMISDFIEEENFRNRRNRFVGGQTDIYFELDGILRTSVVKCNKDIIRFLSIKKFPLILTTSFVSALESELQGIYDNIEYKVYDKSGRSDIPAYINANKPNLYYLFGRHNRIKKSYMVTEDDLLDYMHLWHNVETRPLRLCDYLKNKFLLVLGCDFPNWLFRFFWHSICGFSLIPNSYEMQGVVARENAEIDKDLIRFLTRIQTQVYDNCESFINEFMKRWESRDNNNKDKGEDDIDIFISYAREDVVAVRQIASKLRDLGATVWLDENELEWSDMYESIIEDKITKAKRFVPIISHTTTQMERRFFRKEWSMAIREMDYRYGMPYIAPIVIDDSNINDKIIPEPFRKTHIISSVDNDFEQEMKTLIRSFR